MTTGKSQGTVRRIIEEENTLLVSISGHDGYFKTTDPQIQQLLHEALVKEEEISFSYDWQLTILRVG